ncbi:Tetratricopeptide repeat 7A [Gossypium australe]|uniref:Tetratricopeptide repeat 7A n=1 Tax=Gossypium australe TaxID=47621 RepID=A0A5B6UY78_9ROSI|nr:Tetratricopeptide repeat 7A [Gossypium australe]
MLEFDDIALFNIFYYLAIIVEDDKVKEFEVWYGLAALYSSLSHWKDVEVCVKKAREMKQYSAELVHTEGKI